jgi:tetratricopeptide (TPR) repeat protein
MKKAVLLTLALLGSAYAADLPKCDKCSISKEYMKCGYYVEQKADLSKQDSCIIYAQSMEEGNSNGRASWYYLVGGDFKAAIKAGESALKVGEKFAAEHIAEAYMLEGDNKKAEKYFSMIGKNTPDAVLMIEKHFEILQKVYPKKFKAETANRLYKQ